MLCGMSGVGTWGSVIIGSNRELFAVCTSSRVLVIRVTKSRRLRWMSHRECTKTM